ncbi:hypothetical protein RFI_19062, partial [Reticulomyxa filosa]
SPFRNNDLIQIEMETNPIMSDADARILIDVKPIQIVWNVGWVKTMTEFFTIAKPTIPTVHEPSLSEPLLSEELETLAKTAVHGDGGGGGGGLHAPTLSSPVVNWSSQETATQLRSKKTDWKQKRQRQLLSLLAQKIQNEIAIDVNGLVILIPEDSTDKESRILVAEIASFGLSNELPFRLLHKKDFVPITAKSAIIEPMRVPLQPFGSSADPFANDSTKSLPNGLGFRFDESETSISMFQPRMHASTVSGTESEGKDLLEAIQDLEQVPGKEKEVRFATDTPRRMSDISNSTPRLLTLEASVPVTPRERQAHENDDTESLTNLSTRSSVKGRSSFVFQMIKKSRKQPGVLLSTFDTVRSHPHKYDTVYLHQQNSSLFLFDSIDKFLSKNYSRSTYQ